MQLKVVPCSTGGGLANTLQDRDDVLEVVILTPLLVSWMIVFETRLPLFGVML